MHNLTQASRPPGRVWGRRWREDWQAFLLIGTSAWGHRTGTASLPVLPGSKKAVPGCGEAKSRVIAAAGMVLKEGEWEAALFSTRKGMFLPPPLTGELHKSLRNVKRTFTCLPNDFWRKNERGSHLLRALPCRAGYNNALLL
uniref:Uncharacterized protein n=1 Tax=Pipistrellus kuhlii TaxID=59472 RepID=A0A7J7ZJK5_PIPKU|nr:hypothetical protein mPipKuh1_009560 [Pipistrellus kuhlii]